MTIVLVTGASGFVGSHVVSELLREGYSVRGAVRSHNVARVSKNYESFGDRFSTVVIDDLVTSDLQAAVKGVDAIIHVASPLAHTAAPEVILDVAVTGATRILDAAVAAGVKQLVITESVVSLAAPADFWTDITLTEKSHSFLTREDALKPSATGFEVYCVSKGLSDLTVRNFIKEHPNNIDITSIHPGYIYGPLGQGQVYDSPSSGTNRFVYALIDGKPGRPVSGFEPSLRGPPTNVDVRDVAKAHVLALKLPPSEEPKRFILSTSTFTWIEAAQLLAEKRPELKDRLPAITGKEPALGPVATLDTSKTESVLGMKNYVKWQDTVLDTIDDLLRVERELKPAT
ncbi:hypothetical protein V8E53_014774 [Lactarius tabidus]